VPNAGSMLQLKAMAHVKMTSGTSDADLNPEQQKIQDKINALKKDKAFVKASPGSPEKGLKTWNSADDKNSKGSCMISGLATSTQAARTEAFSRKSGARPRVMASATVTGLRSR
jgi:hypothetical protein